MTTPSHRPSPGGPGELPQPDLRDWRGRVRRLVVAALIGIGVGSLAYFLANTLIEPEAARMYRRMTRETFIAWVAAVSWVVSFGAALVIQNWLTRRRSQAERVPRAQVASAPTVKPDRPR